VSEKITSSFSFQERFTVFYHSLFDFPLKKEELKKWLFGKGVNFKLNKIPQVDFKDGFYFLKGKESQIKKRKEREKISNFKMRIAKKAAKILRFIPTVKMVGVTGSLAMKNTDLNSDIDLMIITKSGFLWISRLLAILILKLAGFKIRKYGDKDTRDKLCLNMWIDESDLVWQNKNLFSAHEIAQVVPLINRDNTYEKFLFHNQWVLSFWPNAVSISAKSKNKEVGFVGRLVFSAFVFFEILAYIFQRLYMRGKITREVVNYKRAVFHPVNLDLLIFKKLEEVLIIEEQKPS
jgi:predicted nucleotidyltransferase